MKELEEQMKERIKDGEKQLEEFKKLSLEKDAEEGATAEGEQKPAAATTEIKKKKNQKPKTSSKKKGKGKK